MYVLIISIEEAVTEQSEFQENSGAHFIRKTNASFGLMSLNLRLFYRWVDKKKN